MGQYRWSIFCNKLRKFPVGVNKTYYRWSKTMVGQVDLTAKSCLPFCLKLQSTKSTYQHVDLDLY